MELLGKFRHNRYLYKNNNYQHRYRNGKRDFFRNHVERTTRKKRKYNTLHPDFSLGLRRYSALWRLVKPIQEASANVSGNQDGLRLVLQGSYVYLILNGGNPDFIILIFQTPHILLKSDRSVFPEH